MATRILSAVLALPVALFLIHRGGWWFGGLVLAAAVICLHEFASMTTPSDRAGRAVFVALGLALVGLALTGRLSSDASLATVAIMGIVHLSFHLFRTEDLATVAQRAGYGALGALWVGGLLASTAAVRLLEEGELWFYLACMLAWGSDTGAYFAGRLAGRHKLYEKVSPKKTWEGAVGGVALATLGAFALRWGLGGPSIPAGHLAILAPLVAALGQVGDLAESLLKRSVGVKDSGRIMPGHGGLLDRVDALLFIGPALLFYALVVMGGRVFWLTT